jgi:hypothetical protein
MTSVRTTLLAVFALHSSNELKSSTKLLVEAFGERSYDAVRALPDYDQEYAYVSDAKQRIEDIATRFPGDAGQQARSCLRWLKKLREKSTFKKPEYEVARELALNTLPSAWPQADRDKFNARLAVIDDWTDFFISYTTRDAFATNNYHQDLVLHEFGWPKSGERKNNNYVARALAKYLEKGNIHGFVDYKSLKCGDDIKDKILGHCRKTIAFVQLVEGATLQEPEPPIRNWCLEEYEAFAQAAAPPIKGVAAGNRLFFVVVANLALPEPADLGPYQTWHGCMQKDLRIVVAGHSKPFEDLRLKVMGIAKQIAETRKEMTESMLQDWS